MNASGVISFGLESFESKRKSVAFLRISLCDPCKGWPSGLFSVMMSVISSRVTVKEIQDKAEIRKRNYYFQNINRKLKTPV